MYHNIHFREALYSFFKTGTCQNALLRGGVKQIHSRPYNAPHVEM